MIVDSGNKIDWGDTSEDYGFYRDGIPDSFYEKLLAHEIGKKNQRILDLGTGTGNLARRFASQGSLVSGIDLANGQIEQAKQLSQKQNLEIDFQVSSAESLPFDDQTFDCVTANQCFMYFDFEKTLLEVKRVLKPDGVLMVSHFSWLPRIDEVARESEKLILKYNPKWTGADWDGIPWNFKSNFFKIFTNSNFEPNEYGLTHKVMFFFDVPVPFSKEKWRGRIRASRGIGASLAKEEVDRFDKEHQVLLDNMTDDSFSILHRIDVNIFSFNDFLTEHGN